MSGITPEQRASILEYLGLAEARRRGLDLDDMTSPEADRLLLQLAIAETGIAIHEAFAGLPAVLESYRRWFGERGER